MTFLYDEIYQGIDDVAYQSFWYLHIGSFGTHTSHMLIKHIMVDYMKIYNLEVFTMCSCHIIYKL
jgi:hypothetical protein